LVRIPPPKKNCGRFNKLEWREKYGGPTSHVILLVLKVLCKEVVSFGEIVTRLLFLPVVAFVYRRFDSLRSRPEETPLFLVAESAPI
jgi:hypothetical protein